jgi:hypothetical protein
VFINNGRTRARTRARERGRGPGTRSGPGRPCHTGVRRKEYAPAKRRQDPSRASVLPAAGRERHALYDNPKLEGVKAWEGGQGGKNETPKRYRPIHFAGRLLLRAACPPPCAQTGAFGPVRGHLALPRPHPRPFPLTRPRPRPRTLALSRGCPALAYSRPPHRPRTCTNVGSCAMCAPCSSASRLTCRRHCGHGFGPRAKKRAKHSPAHSCECPHSPKRVVRAAARQITHSRSSAPPWSGGGGASASRRRRASATLMRLRRRVATSPRAQVLPQESSSCSGMQVKVRQQVRSPSMGRCV